MDATALRGGANPRAGLHYKDFLYPLAALCNEILCSKCLRGP
jgi:hypothetical protein